MSRILKQYKHVLYIIYFSTLLFLSQKVYEVLLGEKQAFSFTFEQTYFSQFWYLKQLYTCICVCNR